MCNSLDHEISVEVKIRQTEEFGERLDALEKVQQGNGSGKCDELLEEEAAGQEAQGAIGV